MSVPTFNFQDPFANLLGEALKGGLGGLRQGIAEGNQRKRQSDALTEILAQVQTPDGQIDEMALFQNLAQNPLFGLAPALETSDKLRKGRLAQEELGLQKEKIGLEREKLQGTERERAQKAQETQLGQLDQQQSFELGSQILSNPEFSLDQKEELINRLPDAEARKQLQLQIRSRRSSQKETFENTADRLAAERSQAIADEITAGSKTAALEDQRLKRMEELDAKGNLSKPLTIATLDKIGLPISILNNPDNEEFRKLEQDFVRDVNDVFRGQIRVFEIQSYLKTVPQLINTPEGRKAIIRNRRLLNDAKLLRKKAYDEIVKENNGRIPRNLDMIIEDRVGNELDALSEQFSSGVNNALTPTQTKVKMRLPDGRIKLIPGNKVEEATAAGAQVI